MLISLYSKNSDNYDELLNEIEIVLNYYSIAFNFSRANQLIINESNNLRSLSLLKANQLEELIQILDIKSRLKDADRIKLDVLGDEIYRQYWVTCNKDAHYYRMNFAVNSLKEFGIKFDPLEGLFQLDKIEIEGKSISKLIVTLGMALDILHELNECTPFDDISPKTMIRQGFNRLHRALLSIIKDSKCFMSKDYNVMDEKQIVLDEAVSFDDLSDTCRSAAITVGIIGLMSEIDGVISNVIKEIKSIKLTKDRMIITSTLDHLRNMIDYRGQQIASIDENRIEYLAGLFESYINIINEYEEKILLEKDKNQLLSSIISLQNSLQELSEE